MTNKKIDIIKKYSHELNNIENIMIHLENGNIYELTKYNQDGYLYTNIKKLREEIYDLINKIEYGKNGFKEKAAKMIDKY
ncbi:hypothetical protein [Senegalia massiliensis]|uniref:Uncharacterized protein n=1 Tax=Senegalia massiliensis TaxID=1720316 RepID=A0A845R306_9CLOT|nr:hypothetical protein [Senegalia massiliensis]NBI08076.1 hypothetical protein [Senegalia massiliensis]